MLLGRRPPTGSRLRCERAPKHDDQSPHACAVLLGPRVVGFEAILGGEQHIAHRGDVQTARPQIDLLGGRRVSKGALQRCPQPVVRVDDQRPHGVDFSFDQLPAVG